MAPGILVENLTKTYRRGNVRALQGVSLAIHPGEIFGVIGPNGAGKTTFFGCLLGLLRADAGQITIDGRLPDDLSIRAITGYLPERLTFDRWMTGYRFLKYQYRLARLPHTSEETEIQKVLEKVDLQDAAMRPIKKYSRGMLQRIGFAQAMLGSPRYLFLDEPASGVDPLGVMTFRSILIQLKASGATVVLNSHQLDQVERVCDRVAFVNNGKVDAIETLNAGSESTRVLRIRWALQTDTPPADATIFQQLAEQAGAKLQEVKSSEALFEVEGDGVAAALLRTLMQHGIQVVEATAQQGRLERLFLEKQDNA